MTGGRCLRRRKMMGRGTDGGCCTEEKPCPISRIPTKLPETEPASLEKQTQISIDFYTQARKALGERSPFGTDDAQVSAIPTLPSGLANCLAKHSDSRKRHKKSHFGVEAKSSQAGGAEKARGSNIWVETEEYFRELTVDDIDRLHELYYFVFPTIQKCFSIPVLGNAFQDNAGKGDIANGVNVVDANAVGSDCGVVVKEKVKEEVKQEVKEEGEQFMEVISLGANVLLQEEKGCSSSSQLATSCSGLEWLLGSRSKIYLATERPSKKRKLLGGDAGLEKLLVACPVEGLSSLCHYCCLGDINNQLNRLIVCSSCNVAVHQRCYGVRDDVAGSWLCSWCKQRNAVQSSDRHCLLCSKQGGALKPVSKRGDPSEKGGSIEFTHLFCCQWMPEVYIQDTRTMGPIMNIEGVKETRRKLVCYLCKVKCGACVRCSNGTCRTSFHPICAREARHKMEIWGKYGCDDVELRAFCLKHSEFQNGNSIQQSGDTSIAIDSDSYVTKHQPLTPTVNKLHKLKIGRKNGDKITVHSEKTDINVNKLGNNVLHEEGMLDARSNSRLQSECGDVQQPLSTDALERSTNEDINTSDSLDFTVILKKLIDQGKVNVNDVASEIGVSPDSLASMLANLLEADGVHDILATNSPKHKGGRAEGTAVCEQSLIPPSDPKNPIFSVVKNHIPDLIKDEAVPSSYIRPLVLNKFMKMLNLVLSTNATCSRDREISPLEASSCSSICCSQGIGHLNSSHMSSEFDKANLEQLVKARNIGLLEISPDDEVEGELIFYQHRLLCNVVARKRFTDELICKVVKSLPQEIDAIGKQKWDAVLVNQYLSELREAQKQGRKERRHKEAQAMLAAATAAAAASSRISSFRKDTLDESAHQENLLNTNTSTGRAGLNSQQMPWAKETPPKLAVPLASSEMKSDFVQSISSDFYEEHPRTCDICRRSETNLNPILVCSSCKVAVHLDCYHSIKNSTSPWYCELCEDLLSSRSSGAPVVNSWEKPYFAAECGLCGGSAGAFRKSTDGQWIHAFCAEWVLESTFRRGQVNPVEGMESVMKGSVVCHICHRKQGVCIKCNYGHCQNSFHPFCARSAGFFMNIKTGGGKLQHKAYCEKHSLEQRAKVETQKHGIEELRSLKQIRVELERLRLLCERIVKREKLKRELVHCSPDILVSKRDSVALSTLVRSPFYPPDGSSESATTSLKGYTDDCRSGSEAIQRSDDVTVDSTVSGKRRVKFPVSMDNDQKTEDSSASPQVFMQKPRERISFGGKQIPHRPSFVASQTLSDDGEKRSISRKHTVTFERELVMTSDQASMKNQRLPKGFVYVPI